MTKLDGILKVTVWNHLFLKMLLEIWNLVDLGFNPIATFLTSVNACWRSDLVFEAGGILFQAFL